MVREKFNLLTVICEPVLSRSLVTLIRSIGASGFTMSDVRGEGSGEKSSGEIPNEKLKIEVVLDSILAKKLMSEIASTYFQDYSIIAYLTEIEVVRQDKF